MIDYTLGLHSVSWALGALVIVVFAIRLYSKVFVVRQPGWEDLLMGLAAAFALTCSALVTVATNAGLGKHIGTITDPADVVTAIKYTFIAPTLSIMAAICGKVSVIVFVVRLLGPTVKKWHIVVLVLLCTVMVGVNFFAVVVMLGYCRPAAAIWDTTVEGVCWSPTLLLFAGESSTVYNAVMDVVVTVFPIMALKKLHMQRSLKISLCMMMGASLFATIATICKAYAMRGITDAVDITFAWAPITLWYTAEMDAIIIFGSLPALLPAWRYARQWSSQHSRYGSSGGYIRQQKEGLSGSNGFVESAPKSRKAAPGMATKALFSIDNSAEEELELGTRRSGSNNSGDINVHHGTTVQVQSGV